MKLRKNLRTVAPDLFFFDTQDDAQKYITEQNDHDVWLYRVRPCTPNDIATQYARFIGDIVCGMVDECMQQQGIALDGGMVKDIMCRMNDCISDNWDAQEQSPQDMGWVGSDGRP